MGNQTTSPSQIVVLLKVASYRHGCDPLGGGKIRLANPACVSAPSASPAPDLAHLRHDPIPFNALSLSNHPKAELRAGQNQDTLVEACGQALCHRLDAIRVRLEVSIGVSTQPPLESSSRRPSICHRVLTKVPDSRNVRGRMARKSIGIQGSMYLHVCLASVDGHCLSRDNARRSVREVQQQVLTPIRKESIRRPMPIHAPREL